VLVTFKGCGRRRESLSIEAEVVEVGAAMPTGGAAEMRRIGFEVD
jgi:hypothetical protein